MSLGLHALCYIFPNLAEAQIVLEDQTYQSNVTVGDWNDPNSWQVWQDGAWEEATIPPNRNNDVFIHQGQEIRLTGNEEVRNLYLFSAADPGRKLNLQTFDLDVYGALRAFQMLGEMYFLNNSANPSMDWIYPETGSIVFKGDSRTVVNRNSWSGQTNYSRFTVRFNPNPGELLIVNAGIKASRFIIETGTVYQTLNQSGTSTFSFNIHDDFGVSDYGSLIILSGARLISDATEEFGQIIRRTDARPATEFILEEGAVLELRGDEPTIDAASVILDGEVRYANNQLSQQFLTNTFPTSQQIVSYHDLQVLGSAIRSLPSVLEISGDFTISEGTLEDNPTTLYLLGSGDQVVDAVEISVSHLEINKSGGVLTFIQPFELIGDFTMRDGMVDFNNQTLVINGSATANYNYIGGLWANLAEVEIVNLPPDFNTSNATFPFFDSFAGENRTLRLIGSLPDQSGPLTIQYIQLPGVEHNANLTDSDDKTIYYHLNSHFLVRTTNASTESLDIQILANDMILDDIADLRISGYGEIAPGLHIPASLHESVLWANRRASLSELNGRTLTLASSGILSVLPLGWLSYGANFLDNSVQLSWKVKAEVGTTFVIYRSIGPDLQFSPVGIIESIQPLTEYHSYDFIDHFGKVQISGLVYYQIRAEIDGILVDESPVFRLESPKFPVEGIQIFPNPYFGGNLTLHYSGELETDEVMVQVIDGRGGTCFQMDHISYGDMSRIEEKLKELSRGLYILRLIHKKGIQQVKWLRE
ncbi:hypothetical protein [Lunatibacter salilacus]|uniref:hypothetical protein n=1 Tax=Lunatibacter salilacus TaxID=2483804 RepID=UPI00131A7753|nr:hypothetical protein [Lunatibacter salilacus]